MYKHIKHTIVSTIIAFSAANALSADLNTINFSELPGEKTEIRLGFGGTPSEPQGYAIDQPPRIVLDFPSTVNRLEQKKYTVAVGDVESVVALEAGGRTRLILNLGAAATYSTRIQGGEYIVEVGGGTTKQSSSVATASSPANLISAAKQAATPSYTPAPGGKPSISNIDFRRGTDGEGNILINLTDPRVSVDVQEVSGGIEVRFLGAHIPEQLRRKLDVVDFATPVTLIGSSLQSDATVIKVEASGEYDYLAYQADKEYVLSVKPLTPQEIEAKKSKFEFSGEKISLSFQDIQVRSVLQLIADFTDLNLVASDTVTGSITLRLDNVPWDQALDLVLKTKGLDKRQIGTVLMVAPAAEIAERERQEIETQKQLEELAPLRTEFIRVRYANARSLFNLFVSEEGGSEGGSGGDGGSERNSTGSILSERGQAIVDERTNSIILTDTDEKIAEFKAIIDQIDIPIRQVMIEARIVIANTDFRKELGVRVAGDGFGVSDTGNNSLELTGSLEGLAAGGFGPSGLFRDSDGDGVSDGERELNDSTIVDLGVFDPAGAFTWNLIGKNFIVGMELSALESSGFAEIVSQPKVITGDKQKASIVSGTEIPFQEQSASGGTTTSFKEAALKLDVVPQITPDNKVIMDLVIEQNSLASITAAGIPVLDITELNTQVLVADGETIVLGGVYTTEIVTGERKVPLLGDIPFVGRLFRSDLKSEDKREILIFVTPRIMSPDFSG